MHIDAVYYDAAMPPAADAAAEARRNTPTRAVATCRHDVIILCCRDDTMLPQHVLTSIKMMPMRNICDYRQH